MMRSEYAIVSLSAKLIAGSQVTVYWPDGTETSEEGSLTVVINRMATQGWEVITSAGGHGIFHWTLKRELNSQNLHG